MSSTVATEQRYLQAGRREHSFSSTKKAGTPGGGGKLYLRGKDHQPQQCPCECRDVEGAMERCGGRAECPTLISWPQRLQEVGALPHGCSRSRQGVLEQIPCHHLLGTAPLYFSIACCSGFGVAAEEIWLGFCFVERTSLFLCWFGNPRLKSLMLHVSPKRSHGHEAFNRHTYF